MSDILLHGYYRSTASYRVRIALNLKALPYRQQSHHLSKGEQKDPAYRALNPQGMAPAAGDRTRLPCPAGLRRCRTGTTAGRGIARESVSLCWPDTPPGTVRRPAHHLLPD
ncbi:glutathione S-transferase N-terminal domain-containing protein [uncultured Sphingobium sp.]|uniref:glutathione S-transferase N-terminal domain-containing protein n=1 Tax=uncultured Sphingobium sp. TaxID=316087 RepID=UPI0034496797